MCLQLQLKVVKHSIYFFYFFILGTSGVHGNNASNPLETEKLLKVSII